MTKQFAVEGQAGVVRVGEEGVPPCGGWKEAALATVVGVVR
jgi:hypothetical protein